MDILDSALGTDIKAITANPSGSWFYYWQADIHCTEQKTITAFKVLSIDFMEDFINGFADEVIMQCTVSGGAYTYQVYPNMNNLEITLYRIPVNEVGGGSSDDGRKVESQRYVATIVNPRNPAITGNTFNQPDENTLDLANLFTVEFQLISKSVDQFRMRSFGGIFRRAKVEDVIKSVLTTESKIVTADQEEVPAGVEMIPANNQTTRDHILIPQGTRLVDVPGYIHQKCGGVYNAGFAYYFQDNTWYVFPPYNNVDFNKAKRTLTLIRVPPNRMPGAERTFITQADSTTAIVTGETKLNNQTESQQLNEGNGVRFGDGDKFMEDFVKVKGNKATAGRGGSNNEFTTIKRPNGYNNVLTSDNKISSNPFVEYSKLAARDGVVLSMSWENSDPTLLFPGMPVKILFMEQDEIRETYGTLIHVHSYVQTLGNGFQSNRHITASNLTIFTKREIDIGDSAS